jgi:hypothetical protein
MTSTENSKSPQVDGGPGTHNTGSDEPIGSVDRPAGAVDPDANPPISDPDDKTTGDGGIGNIPPQKSEAVVPPYEGRQTSTKDIDTADDSGTGGASRPQKDPEYRSPAPQDTPDGVTASPAEQQPASQGSEAESDDEGVEAPTHVAGTRRGEDKP